MVFLWNAIFKVALVHLKPLMHYIYTDLESVVNTSLHHHAYIPNTDITDNSHVTTDHIFQQDTQFFSLVDEGKNIELQIAKFILYLRTTTKHNLI